MPSVCGQLVLDGRWLDLVRIMPWQQQQCQRPEHLHVQRQLLLGGRHRHQHPVHLCVYIYSMHLMAKTRLMQSLGGSPSASVRIVPGGLAVRGRRVHQYVSVGRLVCVSYHSLTYACMCPG